MKFHAWRVGILSSRPGPGVLTVKGPGVPSAGLSIATACSPAGRPCLKGQRLWAAGGRAMEGLPETIPLTPGFLLETQN